MKTSPHGAKVNLTVCFWEKGDRSRALKASRTVPVEHGAPVIWAFGRFISFFKEMLKSTLDPRPSTIGHDPDFTFRMFGQEVFWWTPVDEPAVLHVYCHRQAP